MTGATMEARGITCRFSGFVALDGVDIALRPGSISGLIGPNGAGKSTLINALSGAISPTAGSVSLDSQDITRMSIVERKRLGLSRSFQKTNIFPDLTLRTQLAVATRAAAVKNMDEVAEGLALTELLDVPARDISYGDQRRLDLALALIGRPKVLLLDEPAAGLTAAESRDLARTIKSLVQRWNVTVLLVEHDMEVVFSICEQLYVLHLGKLLTHGAPQEVRANKDVITAYLGSSADEGGDE
ncbi:MAG: ABC transporter ATP-binding protein [Rhizobiaceae bacterium]